MPNFIKDVNGELFEKKNKPLADVLKEINDELDDVRAKKAKYQAINKGEYQRTIDEFNSKIDSLVAKKDEIALL